MQRWRDDSRILDELGVDAGAFDASDVPDLVGLKRRLEDRIAEGAQPVLEVSRAGARWAPWVGAAAIVAAAAGLWWVAGDDLVQSEPPVSTLQPTVPSEGVDTSRAPSLSPVAAPSADSVERSMEAGDPVGKGAESPAVERPPSAAPLPIADAPAVSRVVPTKRSPPSRGVVAVAPSPVKAPKPTPVAAVVPEADAPEPPAPRLGDLQAQLAMYEAGRGALRAGQYAAARDHFEAYLSRFPEGELRQEAEVSLLEALVRSGRHSRASTLAGRLAKRSSLAHRKGEFLRVRAESLAHLGRCDAAEAAFGEAVQAQAGLDATGVLDALRHCRDRQEPAEVSP